MRRLLLVALLLPFSGCSYLAHFVIANRSSSEVRVWYRVDNAAAPEPFRKRGCLIDRRPEMFILERKDTPNQRVVNARDTLMTDAAGCSVTLMLPPGRGVTIWKHANFHDEDVREVPFPNELEITGLARTRTFRGVDDVLNAFERPRTALYVLRVND
jgi:hypothetical protein